METDRLVLLTSAADEADTSILRSSLKAWATAGMLGHVAWAHAEDLTSSLERAACEAVVGRNWVSGTFGSVTERGLSELWLVALRAPADPSEPARRAEDAACDEVLRQVGSSVKVRSMAVTVPRHPCEYRRSDFSGAWEAHLLHDRRITASSRSATTDASAAAPLVLGAALALCVTAGWSGAEEALDLSDRYSGQMKHPRIAHAQIRVLYAPDIASLGAPESPPWPAPRSAGTRAALSGSVPPENIAEQVVEQCGFECEPLRGVNDAESPRGLWRSLLGQVRPPSRLAEAELAIGRLAQRTGGVTGSLRDGMSRLELHGVGDSESLDSLIEHIKKSRFPVGVRSSGAQGSSPEVWQTIRSTMLGLVDGSDLPQGVPPVVSHDGPDGERFVWLDPSAIAPPRVPQDDAAQGILGHPLPRDVAEDHATPAGSAYSLSPEDLASISRADEEPDGPVNGGAPQGAPEPNAPTLGNDGDDGEDSEDPYREGEFFEPEVDALPVGGHHDTLMSLLGARIDRGISRAHAQFLRSAAVRPPDTVRGEYEDAVVARRRARVVLAAAIVVVLAAVAAGLDQRWPYLAAVWETATPWDARTSYGPRIWPVGWILIGSAVALSALWACSAAVRSLRYAVKDLNAGEALRRRHAAGSTHYAGELLRLDSLREQFRDHRRILTEILHRPLGDPRKARRDAIDFAALRLDPAPPVSMLVGAADPSEELVEAEQKKLKEQMTRRGWLTNVYDDVGRAWEQQYAKSVLGDFAAPDEDASPTGATVFRDPRDGRPVRGAREDFTSAVALEGWAVREAVASRWRRLLSEGADSDDQVATMRYLELLEPPAAVHGAVAAHRSNQEFLDAGTSAQELPESDARHRFSWGDTLAPVAASRVPKVHAFATPVPVTAGRGPDVGTVVMMAWRVEYSDQVPPDHLRGWHDDYSDDRPRSTGGVT